MMKLNIVNTYFYLLVSLSHGFHPVDDKGCTFEHSVSLYEGFLSFRWKPMKYELLLKRHGRRFAWVGCKPMIFVSSIKSFRCYLQACKMSVRIFWSIAFYYASFLEWINRGEHHSGVFQWKTYFLFLSY